MSDKNDLADFFIRIHNFQRCYVPTCRDYCTFFSYGRKSSKPTMKYCSEHFNKIVIGNRLGKDHIWFHLPSLKLISYLEAERIVKNEVD